MTGSDWRSYEVDYKSFNSMDTSKWFEPGFAITELIFNKIGADFFLFLGVMKALYLYSLIYLLKKYTLNWLAALVLLMPSSLIFLLIDNPLRFMIALIFINIAIGYIKGRKIAISYIFILISVLFHQTAIFFLLLPIFVKLAPHLFKAKSIILVMLYILVLYISTNSLLLEKLMSSSLGFIMTYIEMKDYGTYYAVEDNESFFTIGSTLQILVFCLIIATKKGADKDTLSKTIWGLAILSLILSRILIMIPTGFRLGIPFGYFFSIYAVDLPHKYQLVKYGLIVYFAMMLYNNVSTHYTYVPYSNSIPYLVTGQHLPYSERSNYNPDAYYKRTGERPQ